MPARNEQDQRYSQPILEGLMQPETKEGVFSRSVQPSFFQAGVDQVSELGERVVRIEGCQVINPPVVERWEEKDITGIVRKKQWKCTFVAPPDLWSQVRDEWIQASTESKKDITVLNRLKLNNGDMCTVIGIQTGERDEPMAKGNKQRHITFVKVTEVIPGIRGTSKKANVQQPKAWQG
jgi:hypothetical protein